VDPKSVFKLALDLQTATQIIVAHNHPSGNLQPSQADILITRKLVEAGKLLDIRLIDHLIIAGNTFYSFADEGKLQDL
jgi:DNA repair protein RadC